VEKFFRSNIGPLITLAIAGKIYRMATYVVILYRSKYRAVKKHGKLVTEMSGKFI